MGIKNVRSDRLSFKDFSFIGPKRSPSLVGWVLLLIGTIAIAFTVDRWSASKDALDLANIRLQTRLAMIPAERAVKPVVEITPEMEMKAQQEQQITKALNLNWEQLFAALEVSQTNDISLLSLQPDPRRGLVMLNGEARNMAAVITYQRKLTANLHDVVLTTHEVQQQNPQQPVRFSISARWHEGISS